jgi:hypothetical protein
VSPRDAFGQDEDGLGPDDTVPGAAKARALKAARRQPRLDPDAAWESDEGREARIDERDGWRHQRDWDNLNRRSGL